MRAVSGDTILARFGLTRDEVDKTIFAAAAQGLVTLRKDEEEPVAAANGEAVKESLTRQIPPAPTEDQGGLAAQAWRELFWLRSFRVRLMRDVGELDARIAAAEMLYEKLSTKA